MAAPQTESNGQPAADKAAGAAEASQPGQTPLGPHPLEPLLAHLAELKAQALHYLQASADRVRLSARQAAIWGAIGLLAALVGATMLITATVLTLQGAANGIAAALGGRLWAGQLIVGLCVLGGAALTCWLASRKLAETSRRKTMGKYERKHSASTAEPRTRV